MMGILRSAIDRINTSTVFLKTSLQTSKNVELPAIRDAKDSLVWHVEYQHRIGRHAVANEDLPAGMLIFVERPFLSVPISRFSAAVCHKCLKALLPSGKVPDPGNPCLPRYCAHCKEKATESEISLDTKLAALRIKLPEIANTHSLDPTMLHIITLMDLQRAGIAAGTPPADAGAVSGLSELRCSHLDYEALTNLWDRKPEIWRKKVGPAVRALHKELVALAESKAIPGYTTPSPVIQLQADAAKLSAHIHTIANPATTTETGVGLFPGLSVFQHSCAPNCFFIMIGSRLCVRTIQDIPKGAHLTVNYVGLTEPRAARRNTLESDRHIRCSCPRCEQPLERSIDRMLEGVLCQYCGNDVLIPVPAGAENELAAEEYKDRLVKDREALAKSAARRGARAGKHANQKKGNGNGNSENPDKTAADQKDGGEEEKKEAENVDDPTALPEGVTFWRCCGCGAVEPAHTVRQDGPADVTAQASRLYQQAMAFINLKHPDLIAQGEALLEVIVGGLEGRLPVYHHRVLEAHAPLININMRKGEAVKVLHLAIQLWDLDRQIVEGRPTMQQLQCLEAIVEAAEAKASAVNSAVIKRQLEKKVKLAHEQLKIVRRILLGK